MFGFFNRYFPELIIETPGYSISGVNRVAGIRISSVDNKYNDLKLINYDVEGINDPIPTVVNPNTKIPNSLMNVTVNYGSTAPLIPATRFISYKFQYSNYINNFYNFYTGNNQIRGSIANNDMVGKINNLDRFQNIKQFVTNECAFNEITSLPPQLEILQIRESLFLTKICEFPSTLRQVDIWECGIGSVVSDRIQIIDNLRLLRLCSYSPYPYTVVNPTANIGKLDISKHSNLEILYASSTNLTELILPETLLNLRQINLYNNAGFLGNSDLFPVIFTSNVLLDCYIRNIPVNASGTQFSGDSIPNSLTILEVGNANISGDITITETHPKPNLGRLILGNQNLSNSNNIPNLDISGLIGLNYLDITNCKTETIFLPETSTLELINMYNNKLDTNALTEVINKIPTVKTLYFGNSGAIGQSGTFGTVDLTGLTAIETCFLNNCNIEGTINVPSTTISDLRLNNNPNLNTIQLATGTNLKTLSLYGCELNVSNLYNLHNQSGITNLLLGDADSNGLIGTSELGSYDASVFTSLISLSLNNCKLTSLTLPTVDTITHLRCQNNPNFTTINRLPSSLNLLYAYSCNLNSLPPIPPNITDLRIYSNATSLGVLDLSNHSSNLLYLNVSGSGVTEIIFPETNNMAWFIVNNNPNLTELNIPTGVTIGVYTTTSDNRFQAYNCSLNITFPIGTRIRSNYIYINNNGMSQPNVDATVDNFFTNRLNFSNVTLAKIFDISGSNSSPTGIYQEPTGFSHNLTDSQIDDTAITNSWTQKEKLWVIRYCQVSSTNTTSRYGWSNITFS